MDTLIHIRPAQETDAPAYRNLRLEALRSQPEAFSADYASNEAQPPDFWTHRLLQAQGSEGMLCFAVHGDDLVGMCGIQRNNSPKTRHGATIWGVYVRAEWRGQRLSDRLIAHCLEWARAQAVKVVRLGVITTNTPAIHCYLRCGFTVYGVEPQSIYASGTMYDELLMARIL